MPARTQCALPIPCDPVELEPLLDALRRGERPAAGLRYPRGTLLPDGRLDLCKQQLGPVNTEAVAAALEGNSFVTSLLLGADFIGDRGATGVARLISGASHIDTLFLGCNGISAEGLGALLQAAEQRPHVHSLWLKRNPLGETGARLLADFLRTDRSITTLDLVATEIDETGATLILETLASHNRTLQRLYLGGNHLGPAIVPALRALVRSDCPLRALYLSSNLLGDTGIEQLVGDGNLGGLETLALSSNAIGCAGARALAKVGVNLKRLELGCSPSETIHAASPNRIEDDGAEALAELVERGSLEGLSLGGNRIRARGGIALLRAVERRSAPMDLELCRSIPPAIRRALRAELAMRALGVPLPAIPEHIQAIESVYRTRSPSSPEVRSEVRADERPAPKPERRELPEPPRAEDLANAVLVLEKLAETPEQVVEQREHALLRAAANRFVSAVVGASRRRREQHRHRQRDVAKQAHATRAAQRARDRALANRPALSPERTDVSVQTESYANARACYICSKRFNERHPEYPALCPTCAALNHEKRRQSARLDGQVAIVIGGRIKIGYQTALKLLRAGARVIVTTRFGCDAALRYQREPDFQEFRQRLGIIAVDFRNLGAVERLAAALSQTLPRLDVLVNNAAQTLARPPEFHASLLEQERRGLGALPSPARALLEGIPFARPVPATPERTLADLFPVGALDEEGQQLDLRPDNSWSLPFERVPASELVEVHAVNSFAPFILTQCLVERMQIPPGAAGHVVNVSAMEGSFSRPYKSERHAHTNMAKSSLNMLTRTIAESLAVRRVYVNSVDTGWITNEQPFEVRRRMREEQGFEPPLDVVDGAARVCDPIFRVALGQPPIFGAFLKNYVATSW